MDGMDGTNGMDGTAAWDAGGPEGGPAADRQAVRTAEQTVSDAWMGRLLLAESETEAAFSACARVRERAAERVRTAQRDGDLAALAGAQAELELADAACGEALRAHDRARTRLAEELPLWARAGARRVRQTPAGRWGSGRR